MWYAMILTGRHALLPFEIFEDSEHTYSSMKYYNTELQSNKIHENILNEFEHIKNCSIQIWISEVLASNNR